MTRLRVWWRRFRGWTVFDKTAVLASDLHCDQLWLVSGATLRTDGYRVHVGRRCQIDGTLEA